MSRMVLTRFTLTDLMNMSMPHYPCSFRTMLMPFASFSHTPPFPPVFTISLVKKNHQSTSENYANHQ